MSHSEQADTVPLPASRTLRLVYVVTVPQSLVFLAGQVGYMRSRGFEVHVISSPGERLDEFAATHGVGTHPVVMTREVTPLRDLIALWRISVLLRRLKPMVVHSFTPKGGLLGMLGAWLARVPARVYHIVGLRFMTATGILDRVLRTTEFVSCLTANRVLCVASSLRDIVIKRRLCRSDKMIAVPIDGIDTDRRFTPLLAGAQARAEVRAKHGIPGDALVLGFVGRIVRDKGVAELVEAWKALREEFPALHLLVVGPFEPQDPVPPKTEEVLRQDPRVRLTGAVPPAEVPCCHAAMDIIALPTYREGLGGAILEGSAMERPVVATRIPGCIDALQDGITGTLVPPRDAPALAAAIRAYCLDPELRRRHGRAGREMVLRDFRPEDIWAAIYKEYVGLLAARGIALPAAADGQK